MLNHIDLMGRLTRDPELRYTQSQTPVASFRIAVDRDFGGRDGAERQTDFIDVVAWRSTAEFVSKWFRKGQMIALQGPIQVRNYEDRNGNKRTAVEIIANEVSFCGSKAEQGSQRNPAEYPPEATQQVSTAEPDDFSDVDLDDELPF